MSHHKKWCWLALQRKGGRQTPPKWKQLDVSAGNGGRVPDRPCTLTRQKMIYDHARKLGPSQSIVIWMIEHPINPKWQTRPTLYAFPPTWGGWNDMFPGAWACLLGNLDRRYEIFIYKCSEGERKDRQVISGHQEYRLKDIALRIP